MGETDGVCVSFFFVSPQTCKGKAFFRGGGGMGIMCVNDLLPVVEG